MPHAFPQQQVLNAVRHDLIRLTTLQADQLEFTVTPQVTPRLVEAAGRSVRNFLLCRQYLKRHPNHSFRRYATRVGKRNSLEQRNRGVRAPQPVNNYGRGTAISCCACFSRFRSRVNNHPGCPHAFVTNKVFHIQHSTFTRTREEECGNRWIGRRFAKSDQSRFPGNFRE